MEELVSVERAKLYWSEVWSWRLSWYMLHSVFSLRVAVFLDCQYRQGTHRVSWAKWFVDSLVEWYHYLGEWRAVRIFRFLSSRAKRRQPKEPLLPLILFGHQGDNTGGVTQCIRSNLHWGSRHRPFFSVIIKVLLLYRALACRILCFMDGRICWAYFWVDKV
jgi:hypothetical protein